MRNPEIQNTRTGEYERLGGAALRGVGIEFSELGVNDYATHLGQYMSHGEAAMSSIEEDFVTGSAEMMVKSKYINRVDFRRAGGDFLSTNGNFSMRQMTANTEDRMVANQADWLLQKRAEIESSEVDRLNTWFVTASTNEVFDVDSLPLAPDEKYAVKRRYQKLNEDTLSMHVIILHSPSTEVFNDYHSKIGANVPSSLNALGILENSYVLQIPEGVSIDDFIRRDVDIYDRVLSQHSPGQEFVFGIPEAGRREIPNSNDVIRRQRPLIEIYKDSIRALGNSNWSVTPEIVAINECLGLGLSFREGEVLSLDSSRTLLDGVHQYIMSTLNNAPDQTLDMLAAIHEHDSSVAYGIASHYGSDSRAAGIRYESSACPTVPSAHSSTEQAAAEQAYRLGKDPTKCVLCPGCKSIVDLPKDLYKKNILHCVECKMTVKNGKLVHHSEVFGSEKKRAVSGFDIISQWFRNEAQNREIKKMASTRAKAELRDGVTYLDIKRHEKEVRLELEKQAA